MPFSAMAETNVFKNLTELRGYGKITGRFFASIFLPNLPYRIAICMLYDKV